MRRYSHIKPVITIDGKLHCFRDYTVREMRETSYYAQRDKDVLEQVIEEELVPWEGHDFSCLHSYGYPYAFMPSVAEILAQISQFDLSWVKAFEIIEIPETARDTQRDSLRRTAFNNGFHVSTVRLYIDKQKK